MGGRGGSGGRVMACERERPGQCELPLPPILSLLPRALCYPINVAAVQGPISFVPRAQRHCTKALARGSLHPP